MQSADLIDTIYDVCHSCKEAKNVDHPEIEAFRRHHWQHQPEGFIAVAGRIFLSKFLHDGFIDVDNEGLQPLPDPQSVPAKETGNGRAAPFGLPGGAEDALRVQRAVAREQRHLESVAAIELGEPKVALRDSLQDLEEMRKEIRTVPQLYTSQAIFSLDEINNSLRKKYGIVVCVTVTPKFVGAYLGDAQTGEPINEQANFNVPA
jgi:hypothetical protein